MSFWRHGYSQLCDSINASMGARLGVIGNGPWSKQMRKCVVPPIGTLRDEGLWSSGEKRAHVSKGACHES